MRGISVIVPIYNAENYLAETLNSLLSQTYKDWVCILVNDGSTDNSLAICEQYRNKDNRFVVYTKSNEKSADMARAYGIEKVKTAWIMYLDADDIIEPAYIEKMVARQQETGADIVSPTMIYFRHELEEEIWRLPCEPLNVNDIITGREAFAYTIGSWKLTTGGMLYRANLEKGVEHGLYINSDEFSSRLILYNAERVVFCNAQYLYRNHLTSTSRKLSPRLWGKLIVNHKIEDFVFEHYEQDENIKRSIVKYVFFKQVTLTAAAWLDSNKIDGESIQEIRELVRKAYPYLKINRVNKYLPNHCNLFMHNENIFIMMSILYTIKKRLQGKIDEI